MLHQLGAVGCEVCRLRRVFFKIVQFCGRAFDDQLPGHFDIGAAAEQEAEVSGASGREGGAVLQQREQGLPAQGFASIVSGSRKASCIK